MGWPVDFYENCLREYEGACAGLQGRTRDDCPYIIETQRDEWNFWVYGCDRAREEMAILKAGKVKICALDVEAQMKEPREFKIAREWVETAEEAFLSGNWKPKYAAVPVEWRRTAA